MASICNLHRHRTSILHEHKPQQFKIEKEQNSINILNKQLNYNIELNNKLKKDKLQSEEYYDEIKSEYITKLNNVNKWFGNKPLNKITEKEIKKVYDQLEDGEIIKKDGNPLGDPTSYYNKIFKEAIDSIIK